MWIFWLQLLTTQLGQFSRHHAAVSGVFFFFCWLKYYNCAVLPWKNILFSDSFQGHAAAMSAVDFLSKIIDWSVGPILTTACCRESCGFFCWLKSYNSAVYPLKSIFFSANFDNTQLPWVPWIFLLKLLPSQHTQFLRHLAAVSAVLFFCWVKCYNSAVLTWKSIVFSDNFHGTQLAWVR